MTSPPPAAQFDEVGSRYESELGLGVGLSGYRASFFAERRAIISARLLARSGVTPGAVIDFGCGNGSSAVPIIKHLAPRRYCGVDVSEALLSEARRRHRAVGVAFEHVDNYRTDDLVDVVFSNGVFHHIVPDQRGRWYRWVRAALRPGGTFLLWENNAWSPAARMVMRRIPFDRDAKPLSILEAICGLRAAGLHAERYRFEFILPRSLSVLSPLERLLWWLPLGSQFVVAARRRD